MLASLGCAVELALTGVLPLGTVVPAMLGVHALIGIGEAVITCVALALFARWTAGSRPAARSFAAPALAALLIALLVTAIWGIGMITKLNHLPGLLPM